MFRLLLLMFLYGVPFETVLVAELQVNIAWRWFVGLGLLEKAPDHSTLCDFRKRLGPQVFVQVLFRLLQICLERGLIRNVDLYFDFTAVHASGTLFKPYQRALLLAMAINRYLDLVETKQTLDQPLVETLRGLVIEVAMEVIDSKSLDKVSPKRLDLALGRGRRESIGVLCPQIATGAIGLPGQVMEHGAGLGIGGGAVVVRTLLFFVHRLPQGLLACPIASAADTA